jgi:adenylate cyclase
MLPPFQNALTHPLANGMPSPDLIKRQVQKILASSHFDASSRNRKFLQFIVEQTLAGHGDRLKGYTIALEVFDRDPSFDPQLDPVVRIEAGRLRRSLERYYLTEGKGSAIAINIPKGKYVPQFEIRSHFGVLDRSAGDPLTVDDHVTVIITPVFDHYTDPENATFDTALTEEIIIEFHNKHKEIGVIVPFIRSADSSEKEFPTILSGAGYVLRGSVRRSENGARIIFHLAEHTTGQLLWMQSFDQDLATVDMIATPRDIATEVVDSVTTVMSHFC